jgi:hypothetical protein
MADQQARQGRELQRWDGETRLVAGCVPIINGKIVLISNRKNRRKWGLPKVRLRHWIPKIFIKTENK